jgi:hypothetical protein
MSPGLAKAVDAERDDRIARDCAEPRQCGRVEVADGDERRTRPQPRQQSFGDTGLAANACRLPSRCTRSGEVIARSPAPGMSSVTA